MAAADVKIIAPLNVSAAVISGLNEQGRLFLNRNIQPRGRPR